MKARIGQHRSRIRRLVENAPLVSHYKDKNHSADEIKCQVVEVAKIPERGGDITWILQRRECYWIDRIDSINQGLNSAEEWRGFVATLN